MTENAEPALDRDLNRSRRQLDLLRELHHRALHAVREGQPLDQLLSGFFSAHRGMGSRDRRLIRETLYTRFRWKGWIEPCSQGEGAMDRALLFAGALSFPSLPAPLELLRVHLNIELPNSLPEVDDWNRALALLQPLSPEPLESTMLIPEGWMDLLPPSIAEPLIRSFQQRPPVWIHILPARKKTVEKAFEAADYQLQTHPVLPRAARIDRPFPEAALQQASRGGFTIQDLASQAVTAVCQRLPVKRWWDACSGSGGKSFVLAEGDVELLASDRRPESIRELKTRGKKLGLPPFQTAVIDLLKDRPRQAPFEGILVDAPCSGMGTWARNADHRWRSAPDEPGRLARRQVQLLEHASESLLPGGWLVYAVCTLSLPETRAVVENFLQAHPDFLLQEVPHPLRPQERSTHIEILPWEWACNGMYIAALRKIGTTNEKPAD